MFHRRPYINNLLGCGFSPNKPNNPNTYIQLKCILKTTEKAQNNYLFRAMTSNQRSSFSRREVKLIYFTSIVKQAFSLLYSRSLSASWRHNQYSRRLRGQSQRHKTPITGLGTETFGRRGRLSTTAPLFSTFTFNFRKYMLF